MLPTALIIVCTLGLCFAVLWYATELQLASIVATAPETKKTKQKTGGRKRDTKNWTHPEIRDALLDKSGAISVLADFVAGRQLYAGQSGSVGKAG